jgi:ATP-dependent exoDNAse (exonuclease V) alpha subunit
MAIEINEHFRRALQLIEDGGNIFVTGRAGTGKSTLLDYFRKNTDKEVVVLAPTGVAAVNVDGQTIHSFFGFGPDITPDVVRRCDDEKSQIYKTIEIIVIDEVSMVRADLMDCVDKSLRLNRGDKRPFGGVQMIFFGDLYQLPPVVVEKDRRMFSQQYKSQYFFDSKVFEKFEMELIELEKIYRQKDIEFINILNAIRNNTVQQDHLNQLNKRVDTSFKPKTTDFCISLTTTNDMADEINLKELARLRQKQCKYRGKIRGRFDRKYLPTDIDLRLKIGSQVMLLNNDSAGRWVNGTVGKIVDIRDDEKKDVIVVETQDKRKIEVSPYMWKMYNTVLNKETGSLESETVGTFTQYPIRLAWAVTIHKGQGKTFDRVIIDIGKGAFAHGQVYVALSRCTSLEGIVLRKPIEKRHIFMDWKISKFLTKYHYDQSEKRMPMEEKVAMIEGAIKNKSKLMIVYLKSNDQKSTRIILPKKVGQMEYMEKTYTGMEAFCFSKQGDRVFRVDRILEMKAVE